MTSLIKALMELPGFFREEKRVQREIDQKGLKLHIEEEEKKLKKEEKQLAHA